MNENPLSPLEQIDPEMMKKLREMDDFIFKDGALSKKVKLLMAMAFDASKGADQGVRSLAQAAQKEGATFEEIAETLRVAQHLSGVGALYVGSAGLRDLLT